MIIVHMTVNGNPIEVGVGDEETLLETLRQRLGLTGTKQGCDLGDCGSCTVLLDGKPVLSCLTLAADAEGHEITTIEGLAQGEDLHPVQRAFHEAGAVQCGFCTPGMVLTAKALLDTNPNPDREAIKGALSGNLCRCTGYVKIVNAVEIAAKVYPHDRVEGV
ncbi:(2Fe-2S)-binding protein [Geobacter argillaceus]|uniref:Carbon-monoxide dehydrogenase small subunit n=1 Tax=Geobacter argillaceus TaxID=345631 RepID=A0A562VGJ1_9BACT|nr:(2Fe-2S)-binding protein [Geobacter argillaceus]TWJ17033.1 carbon-monoxide dehydrogenase small subunit [Geobacter argillaceus]